MAYDYKEFKESKERIVKILNSELKVEEKKNINSLGNLKYDNSYISWVTGIFIDIRNSASLFANEDKVIVSKIIKSFTSEVIEILRSSSLSCLEQGIRGDCVYAVYSSPNENNEDEVLDMAYYINTLMNMLNKLYKEKGYHPIKVGIGISTGQELIIKAGRKNVPTENENIDANAIVWVGEAVSKASKLSGYGNKNGIETIVISTLTYQSISDDNKKFFAKYKYNCDGYTFYHRNVTKKNFNNWINGGMN